MSAFDAESFLDVEVEGSNTTEYTPVPEMDDALSLIKDVSAAQSSKDDKVYTRLNVVYIIQEEEAQEATKLEEPTVRQTIFLDMTDDGRIDMSEGKNIQLGRLRAACGLNEGAFSFRQLQGQNVRTRIKHRSGDEGEIYAEVKGVKPA